MPHYHREGDVPAKRHLRVAHPSGAGFLAEELMGTEGFSQESALLYHLNSPSALIDVTAIPDPRDGCPCTPDHPLTPRHVRTGDVRTGPRADAVMGRVVLLGNADVTVCWAVCTVPSPLYRNAGGDDLAFLQRGSAVLESVFGAIAVREGDYVVIPAGTTHRWVPGADGADMLVMEARGHVSVPARYLTDRGQMREGAPFAERDLRGPELGAPVGGDDPGVVVRNRAGLSRLRHAHHPFDVVGWDGCLYPYAFSIHNFEPIVGAIHQPPPVHQTFAGPGFVVCSFVPRPFDFHPDAIKVPYHHANVDSDEVLFYVDGDFMSRRGSGIEQGSISFHPAGFVHGPQPGSLEGAIPKARTEEVAVMLDTFSPLGVSDAARAASAPDYPMSWSAAR